MNYKNNSKNKENKPEINKKEGSNQRYSQPGTYLRDDHCDWGSSGMNEYTKEFDNIQ